MFTVKATFRNETRRFTFENALFPSFEELYEQVLISAPLRHTHSPPSLKLTRVFPITRAFYLSRIFFTQSNGTVLIGVQAESEEKYNTYIAPYRHNTWPDALLRFSVHDDTVENGASSLPSSPLNSKRKVKDREADDRSTKRFSHYYDHHWRPVPPTPPRIPPPPPWIWGNRQLPTPPAGYSVPAPPPPILYSPFVTPSHIPMDVDDTAAATPRQPAARPRAPTPQQASCCEVSAGKEEMQKVITEFMSNFDRIMVQSFGADYRAQAAAPAPTPAPAPPVPEPAAEPTLPIPGSFTETPVHTGVLCDVCNSIVCGVRHKCLDCPGWLKVE
jgi:next-to-BRCA1 protein 1